MFDDMFNPDVEYEAMNFLEKILFWISDVFIGWVEVTFSADAITNGLEGIINFFTGIFGENPVAYAFVDLLDLIGKIIGMF